MSTQITFYLSRILGSGYYSESGTLLGKIRDLLIEVDPLLTENEPVRPRVAAIRVTAGKLDRVFDATFFEIQNTKRDHKVVCSEAIEVSEDSYQNCMWLAGNILDRQIVDINGRKLVRVNDVRLVMIPAGIFALAVDVGVEGLLRRLGIDKLITTLFSPFRITVPSKFILWDDIEAVDFAHSSIRLSMTSSKLNKLHPSDLADIIEELDRASRTIVFASLDEEKAADVLEELEPKAQIEIVESFPVDKVADVLEKMPADEVADLLDALEDDKAEKLLAEMERESSAEVMELLEYEKDAVGSLMSTDYYTFSGEMTVEETISELRTKQPEPSHIYAIFVVDRNDRFVSAISLGELIIADPAKKLKQVVPRNPVSVLDNDNVDTLAELVSKYNLLAVPVINNERKMEGVVMVEDIVDDLLGKRKTK
jgi:magnesium transporter